MAFLINFLKSFEKLLESPYFCAQSCTPWVTSLDSEVSYSETTKQSFGWHLIIQFHSLNLGYVYSFDIDFKTIDYFP